MKHVRDFHSQSWNNPFFEHDKGRSWTRRLQTYGVLVIFAIIIYVIIYSPLLRVGAVTVRGASSVDAVRISAAAMQTLAGYDYLVVPKDQVFDINTAIVKNYLLIKFPSLLSVEVRKKFRRLEIIAVERQPTFRLIIGDASYLLDQEGIGMRPAAPGEGDALVAIEADNVQFISGRAMIQAPWLSFINDLHKYFATQVGVRDQLFKLDAINNNIDVVTAEGWYAIFDPDTDLAPQLQTLSSALGALVQKTGLDARKKLLYIYASFGDHVPYMEKQ